MPYNSIQISIKYLRYLKQSKTRYRVHSPFVFSLIENVLRRQPPFYAFKKIEQWRDKLFEDKTELNVKEFGAGSRVSKSKLVRDIAETAVSSQNQSEWLFGLANYFKAKTIVELGTSVGVSTAYLAAASKTSWVYTFEGNEELIEIATEGWQKLKIRNVEAVVGDIDIQLPKFLGALKTKIDLVYLDANHTYEATINYFNQLKPFLDSDSMVIVDDIHWSEGMEKAWFELKNDEQVSISIDLFYKGLLFFRSDIEEEHFVLRI